MINLAAAALIAAATLTPTPTGFGWVCPTLDQNPSVDGVWNVVLGAYQRGLTSDAAAEQIVIQIRDVCPEYIPIVKEWAEQNG